jgi:uncharacterized membrane protein
MSNTRIGGTFVRVSRAVTIGKPPEEVYSFWRDLSNLPSFAQHLESVKATSERESRWLARGPMDQRFEWEAEITAEEPNRLLAWRTRPGGQIEHQGEVRFQVAPNGQGTEVVVVIDYRPPLGSTFGDALVKFFGKKPEQQLSQDLGRFKALMETGEFPTTEGQSAGAGRNQQTNSKTLSA